MKFTKDEKNMKPERNMLDEITVDEEGFFSVENPDEEIWYKLNGEEIPHGE